MLLMLLIIYNQSHREVTLQTLTTYKAYVLTVTTARAPKKGMVHTGDMDLW